MKVVQNTVIERALNTLPSGSVILYGTHHYLVTDNYDVNSDDEHNRQIVNLETGNMIYLRNSYFVRTYPHAELHI